MSQSEFELSGDPVFCPECGKAIGDGLYASFHSMVCGETDGEWEEAVPEPDAPAQPRLSESPECMQLSELLASLLGPDRPAPNRPEEWLVLEGDWGGQVYATVPLDLVRRQDGVMPLLREMDAEQWPENAGDGIQVLRVTGDELLQRAADDAACGIPAEEIRDPGILPCAIDGGMGGGMLDREVWLHQRLDPAKWLPRVREFLGIGPDA